MTTAARVSADEWVERARSMAPIMEQHRDATEAQRHVAAPVAAALRERRLFALWTSRHLGGPEVTIETSVRVMEELARQDASVAWCVMLSGNHSILWGYLTPEAAARCVAGGRVVIAGTVGGSGSATMPGGGIATPVEGGYRLSGRWAFASGIHHADWVTANGRISENGDWRRAPNGEIGLFSFLVPQSEVTILDTWFTTGMRGTGSHHFEGTDLFVPEERVFSSQIPDGHQPSPLYSTARATPWSANIAGVALGIGRDAIDTFVEVAKLKPAARNRSSLIERETIWRAVGEAEARLRSARAFLLDTAREVDGYIERDEPIPDELAARTRAAASNASGAACDAVDAMYTNAGSSSIYATSRLDRCFRDIHTLTQHAIGGLTAGFTLAGRYYLGIDAPTRN